MFKPIFKEQEDVVRSLVPKCQNICMYIYPIDDDKSDDCILKCSEQNRNLFRMENNSTIALIVAILFLCLTLFIQYKMK